MIKKIFVLFSLTASYLFIALPAFAQLEFRTLKEHSCLAEGTSVVTLDCVPVIIGNIVFWLLVFAGIVALVLIIISGFKFVTSGGEPKKAEGARKTLTYAIIGLVVILFSFAIISFIEEFTGLDKNCITRFGFSQCIPADLRSKCSPSNPEGFCSDEEKECLPIKERPTLSSCQFRCGNNHPNGWCGGNKTCTETRTSDEYSWEVDYLCR